MDVVYVHKKKRSEEIRWSIKSVMRNLPHRNIYVIGDDPWVDGVIHVPHEKYLWGAHGKYSDQIGKYRQACDMTELSDDFIAMNDDFFVLEPWTPENYNQGQISAHIRRRRIHDRYSRTLQNTIQHLQKDGCPTLDFDLHTPFVYNKARLKEIIDGLRIERSRELQIRSVYGNMQRLETEYREDVKNIKAFEGATLLSTGGDSFANDPIGQYIRGRLP